MEDIDRLRDRPPYRDPLDIREQIARIDRNQAEIQKLFAEANKLNSDGPKLQAEARKYRYDPVWLLAGAIIAAIAARLPEILHAFGRG